MARKEPKLEVYVLIFGAPCAGLAPDSWFGQKIEMATDQKTICYIFGIRPQGPGGFPGVPRSRGAFITRKRSPRPKKLTYRGPDAQFWQENVEKNIKKNGGGPRFLS